MLTKTSKQKNGGHEHQGNPLLELFLNELKDIYWAEKFLTRALPKLAKAAENEELTTALEKHLEETKEQLDKLDRVFEIIDKKPQSKKCDGMEGIVAEGEKILARFKNSPALDAAIITASQKIEHYEIASYGTLRTFATRLGLDDAADILQEILDEEVNADRDLTEIAESMVNEEAEHGVES